MHSSSKFNYIKIIFKVYTLLLLAQSGYCLAESVLTLSTYAGPPLSNSNQSGFYDQVLNEAFSRAGHKIKIIQLPAERSLINANEGIVDGDFVRISGLSALYQDLIRVPEKIINFDFVAFTKDSNLAISDWQSTKGYHIGIVRGWKILEKNLVGAASLSRVKNQQLLFKLLDKNRVDIVVYSRFEGYELINQLDIKGVKVLEPPLETREMFLYLNKQHSQLVPIIAQNIMDMKKDGSYDEIFKKTLLPYLQATN